MLKLDTRYLKDFVTDKDINLFSERVKEAHDWLHLSVSNISNKKGWLDLPINYDKSELYKIKLVADKIKKDSDVLIVIGIGGSYLGTRAGLEFIKSPNYNYMSKSTPNIFFVGNNLSSMAMMEILDICKDKEVSLNVISKSGTTTECAIAFRIFRKFLEEKYGDEARNRIYCTTDPKEGSLRELAVKNGYQTFEIHSDIGGRYSVLTAVGLLPLAVAGIDIDKILRGAIDARSDFSNPYLSKNDCYKYAVLRNILYQKGKSIEMISGYEPKLHHFFEWWKQLFGESEGKYEKGIFPASAIFSSDLHSMGQFIQEGSKILFETVLTVKDDDCELKIPNDSINIDKLNYLANRTVEDVNRNAFLATIIAHTQGGTPNIHLEIDCADEYHFGYMVYFFEKACAISAYLLGVNPFDQPGVEAYKNNMFSLLGKPGYETHIISDNYDI